MKFPARIRRAVVAWVAKQMTLSGVDSGRGWFSLWRFDSDTATGSWQQDATPTQDSIIQFAPAHSCITLISSDIGKICIDLKIEEKNVWVKTSSAAFSPVLKKPNHYQTRQQFIETWIISKLRRGNTYALKIRDDRSVVKQLYVLDPDRVTPLVAPDGSVFYELRRDDLSHLPTDYPAVPAREIIHDRMDCLFHPLVGISPLYAALLSSSMGLRIQRNSERFFRNMSRPGGMLTAPGAIDDETAARMKHEFEANYSNEKIGRLFVAGSGLEYKVFAQSAEEAQLVEQLKLSAEQVCSVFHVPAYMIGAGPLPSYNNVEALTQQYYQQCLQKLFNAIEDLLDDGLGLTALGYRTEFDLEDLVRMDQGRQVELLTKASGGAYMKPNEARQKAGMLPTEGGDALYKQHQDYSIAALAKRDAQDDPFKTAPAPAPAPAQAVPPTEDDVDAEEQAKFWRGVADIPEVAGALMKDLPLLPQSFEIRA